MKSKEPLRLVLTERFRKSALELEPEIREKLKKQIGLLASDPRHPSLRVKKIQGHRLGIRSPGRPGSSVHVRIRGGARDHPQGRRTS